MGAAPRVSLITPTYNQADYLAETLDCVLAQSFAELEYIVIDDGSTDRTAQVLAGYEGRGLEIRRQANQGQVRTLNEAWRAARGEYLAYLSSDDLLLPQALERLVAELDAHPEAVCVFPNSDLIDANSRRIRTAVCRPFDLAETVITQECFIGPGALFRRSAFEQLGGWREDMKLAPDREFWIRLTALGEIRMLDESLALYRTHPEATSFKSASEQVSNEYLRVLDLFYARADIEPALQARKDEAYAGAYLMLARNALWRADFGLAWQHYRTSRARHASARGLMPALRLIRRGISKPAKVIYTRLATRLLPRPAERRAA